MKKESYQKLAIVTVFALAMAFLEATVVIYLRKIYYPLGFNFPLKGFIDPQILSIEWIREAFTIIMLVCIAMLVAKKFYRRFAYFLYSFAIWDIFYYVWLKLALDWPASFLTWDLLFLIPFPWIGPVLAPIICSLTMILFTWIIIEKEDAGKKLKFSKPEWALLILGGLLILYTFLIDYARIIISGGFLKDFLTLSTNQNFIEIISSFFPQTYNWILFLLGEIVILIAIFKIKHDK